MLKVVAECVRVCVGPVFINCASGHRKRCYWPAPEGLLYRWWKQGGECYRPCFYHRVGIPGSGGTDYLRADVEYILCFKRPGALPYFDVSQVGHPPKWAPGGSMSHRTTNGKRVNQWGHSYGSGGPAGARDHVTCGPPRPSHRDQFGFTSGSGRGRKKDGTPKKPRFFSKEERRETLIALGGKIHTKRDQDSPADDLREQVYLPPAYANPGNLIKAIVGGGVMGHPLCHGNEAPFAESLPSFFIRGFTKPGDVVLDPFSGSGTTVSVAHQLGRAGIGMDLRMNQCSLAVERITTPNAKKKKKKQAVPKTDKYGTLSLW